MEAKEIIAGLKSTPYKFTYASKIRSEIRSLSEDHTELIVIDLKSALVDPLHHEMYEAIKEIIR